MESRMAGEGWSFGVNRSVAVKLEKMDEGNKKEEWKRSWWGQQPCENVEVMDRQYNTCSHLMFTCGYE